LNQPLVRGLFQTDPVRLAPPLLVLSFQQHLGRVKKFFENTTFSAWLAIIRAFLGDKNIANLR